MPATPMNDAADRYSPEMADAFQPTDTDRPATKKSLAVLERRADQKPMPIVTTTVIAEKAKIHGSKPMAAASGRTKKASSAMAQRRSFPRSAGAPPAGPSEIGRLMKPHETTHTNGKNRTPSTSHVSVNPATRV